MPRVKKPAADKLSETVNTPVNRSLKKRLLAVAKARGIEAATRLARQYIEAGVARDEQEMASTADQVVSA